MNFLLSQRIQVPLCQIMILRYITILLDLELKIAFVMTWQMSSQIQCAISPFFTEKSLFIQQNIMTRGELYNIRRQEFANTGTVLLQPEGQEEREIMSHPTPDDIIATTEVFQFMELELTSILVTALSKCSILY